MTKLLEQLKAARRVSVPIVAINTPDAAATIGLICEVAAGEAKRVKDEETGKMMEVVPPVVQYDLCRMMTPCNEAGKNVLDELKPPNAELQFNPIAPLLWAVNLPKNCTLVYHLGHKMLGSCPTGTAMLQAIWNLRDVFKRNARMLVLLGTHFELPAEIAGDVVLLDEPLPDRQQLSEIVMGEFVNAGVQKMTPGVLDKAIEALTGLPAFAAEQVTAMSLTKKPGSKQRELDIDQLWERKRQQIEQTPGLRVYRGGEEFSDIGGVEVVKDFLNKIMQGQAKPNCVVFIDEIEKMLAGARGDMSGVTQDQLGSLLAYMQDNHAAGMIFVGPPGSAKSMVAKAAGSAGETDRATERQSDGGKERGGASNTGVPTIQLDLGAAKGSLVGQSEQQMRVALKVITAVSNGKSLWIATCNSIGELPPELRRRFTLGTFFFDLPSKEEREKIWGLWRGKYIDAAGADESGRLEPRTRSNMSGMGFSDDRWTGAEIRQCCEIAWRLGITLAEASKFIVPVAKSASEQIERLRQLASGRFLSASYPGVYDPKRREQEQLGQEYDKKYTAGVGPGSRKRAVAAE